MMRVVRLTVLGLFLCTAAPAFSEEDKAPDLSSFGPELRTAIERELKVGVRSGTYQDLYHRSIADQAGITPVIDYLASLHGEGSTAPAHRQQAAAWVALKLIQRRGDLRTALDMAIALSAQRDDVLVVLARAWLEDALGKARDALASYESVLDRIEDDALETETRLRIALLGKDGNRKIKETLSAFAAGDGLDKTFRNRAAVVLALKGHPEEAAALYEVGGEGSARFRQETRLVDWAMQADDPESAQAHAWSALEAATLRRDRRYALTVLIEAHRADDSIPALIERFANTEDLGDEAREVWIDLLRETGEIEEALRLFRASRNGHFTVDMRRELLEMCRESGDEAVLLDAYRDLIAEEPQIIEWREGLARHYLERGDQDAATAVWSSYLDDPELRIYLLAAGEALAGLGLDELATRCAETAIDHEHGTYAALLFLHQLHKRRGRMPEAEAVLERMDAMAPADAPERIQMAEAWEQMGRKDKAAEVLEAVSDARGAGRAGEDLEMRLAWLQSEIGKEDEALKRWHTLWQRVESVPRRRYVEDRLMTVASRLGKLADIAIELEEKLEGGTATARDSGMLVRLYTKVNDAVSATEVIEEYMKNAGGDQVKTLTEKARVFLACTDYHNYEKTVRQLIDVDPEGEGDYLRQLAMSQLERGKPDEARDVLSRLKEIESGSDSAEFEAGVLALAGLRDEAIAAYRKGVAAYPDRIESYLLMANLLREVGEQPRAIGMFQHLAATAKKDDLFTIAIDGLLNLEAPAPILRWARRVTLERLAGKHDKMYLYQLLADLSEELSDRPFMMRALQSALPIAGERRSSQLRELMDIASAPGGDKDKQLVYGRRLIGLGEVAPPQVYLDLGQAFLKNGEVTNAAKTFALATEVPDYASFQLQVAEAFETQAYLEQALRVYERLLVSRAGDVALLTKVGELHEQLGRDDRAAELYQTALDLLIRRRPFSTFTKKEDEDDENQMRWYWARNVDEFDQYVLRVTNGVLVTMQDGAPFETYLAAQTAALRKDLERVRAEQEKAKDEAGQKDDKKKKKNGKKDDDDKEDAAVLKGYPRVQARLDLCRRMAVGFGRPDLADDLDIDVLRAFPDDDSLLESICRDRVTWGFMASARRIIDASGRDDEQKQEAGVLVGGAAEGVSGFMPVSEGARLFLPLLAKNAEGDARALLQRLDLSQVKKEDLEHMPVLVSAALQLEDGAMALKFARHWVKALLAHENNPSAAWTVVPAIKRIKGLLDPEKYRSLCEYLAGLIIDNAEKQGNWLSVIPQLQADFEEPLLSEEQLEDLLSKLDGNRWYWLGSFFQIVPESKRSSALRKMLPKVPPSQRVQFLLQLVQQFKDPVAQDFADYIVESFDSALADIDKSQSWIFYSFLNLANGDVNVDLRLRLVELPPKKGMDNDLPHAARAILLKKKGEADAALEAALETYGRIATKEASGPNSYHINMARTTLQNAFIPDHLDAFLGALDKRGEEGADALAITKRRMELIARANDLDRQLAEILRALEAHPDEDQFLTQLERQYRRMGRTLDALHTLEQMIEKKPEDENLKRRLMASWQALKQPIKALAIKKQLDAEKKAKVGDEPQPERAKRWVQPQDVKKAIEEGELGEAQTAYRRMWRTFPVGSGNRFARFYGGRTFNWPQDRTDEQKAEARLRARGGLTLFQDEDPEPREVKSAHDALAAYDFGEAEMRRQVRIWNSWQLAAGGPVIGGLVKGMVRRLGTEGARDVLMGAVERGRAGKLEYGLLLVLLQEQTDLVSDEALAMLDDLSRTLKPTDVAQIRKLAKVWARMGGKEEASRLYRWCAAQSGGNSRGGMVMVAPGMFMSTSGGGSQGLVQEVGKELEGELRIKTVEQILAFSDPGFEKNMFPGARDPYESLVLDTWIKILGPERALEMCRDVCESVSDLSKGLRRSTAKTAAYLLARAGEHDAAVTALETALCKLDAPADTPPYYASWYQNPTHVQHADIRRLFPKDVSGWASGVEWMKMAADKLATWTREERTLTRVTFQALAVATLRLHEAGEDVAALSLLEDLKTFGKDSTANQLWVIDVARAIGAEDTAYALERKLLEAEQLNLERVGEVIGRIADRDGPAAALGVGEKLAAYTLHPGLTEALIEVAERVGDAERAAHWRSVAAEAEAATEALKPKPTAGAAPAAMIR